MPGGWGWGYPAADPFSLLPTEPPTLEQERRWAARERIARTRLRTVKKRMSDEWHREYVPRLRGQARKMNENGYSRPRMALEMSRGEDGVERAEAHRRLAAAAELGFIPALGGPPAQGDPAAHLEPTAPRTGAGPVIVGASLINVLEGSVPRAQVGALELGMPGGGDAQRERATRVGVSGEPRAHRAEKVAVLAGLVADDVPFVGHAVAHQAGKLSGGEIAPVSGTEVACRALVGHDADTARVVVGNRGLPDGDGAVDLGHGRRTSEMRVERD
ncbi:hypothetical protein ACTVZO_41305 [Streptomyces sp. IBSNAI002]|uniref:hypothetical protein n=1 Tax=Streptomyces sp. IBSNAI002 TaxID=3457500 RepID=UPI003FD04023